MDTPLSGLAAVVTFNNADLVYVDQVGGLDRAATLGSLSAFLAGQAAFTAVYAPLAGAVFAGALSAPAFALAPAGVNAQTGAAYTLQASDNGRVVTFDNAAAVTLTIPAGLPVGFSCLLLQLGAGAVVIAGAGVALHNGDGLTTTGRYAPASLFSPAPDVHIAGGLRA
jgi:hypothetical protein